MWLNERAVATQPCEWLHQADIITHCLMLLLMYLLMLRLQCCPAERFAVVLTPSGHVNLHALSATSDS